MNYFTTSEVASFAYNAEQCQALLTNSDWPSFAYNAEQCQASLIIFLIQSDHGQNISK